MVRGYHEHYQDRARWCVRWRLRAAAEELPPPFRSAIKPFQRPEGHTCKVSSGVHDCLTFGTGTLDDGGFWSVPCYDVRGA